jgi:hypothetical protein
MALSSSVADIRVAFWYKYSEQPSSRYNEPYNAGDADVVKGCWPGWVGRPHPVPTFFFWAGPYTGKTLKCEFVALPLFLFSLLSRSLSSET